MQRALGEEIGHLGSAVLLPLLCAETLAKSPAPWASGALCVPCGHWPGCLIWALSALPVTLEAGPLPGA